MVFSCLGTEPAHHHSSLPPSLLLLIALRLPPPRLAVSSCPLLLSVPPHTTTPYHLPVTPSLSSSASPTSQLLPFRLGLTLTHLTVTRLSYAFSQYYELTVRAATSWDFAGKATVNTTIPNIAAPSNTMSSCLPSPTAVFTPSATATVVGMRGAEVLEARAVGAEAREVGEGMVRWDWV
ncbi:hypothetical protein B0H14DRAFT_3573506 [Mycena olivaceomarginata]|nr:hypothetical protein B0H14DRAFT_3573506 [Mycena olivaceomarginata]